MCWGGGHGTLGTQHWHETAGVVCRSEEAEVARKAANNDHGRIHAESRPFFVLSWALEQYDAALAPVG
jgi:hypothetical protein